MLNTRGFPKRRNETPVSYTMDKTEIRRTVREAANLHRHNALDYEALRDIVASALAWEMATRLDEKVLATMAKFEDKLHR